MGNFLPSSGKRDDFDFHVVNFLFLPSDMPSGTSYDVYISLLIKYARCCSYYDYYDDFRYRHKMLVERLVFQRYRFECLRNSFKKLYDRYHYLFEKYQRSVLGTVKEAKSEIKIQNLET